MINKFPEEFKFFWEFANSEDFFYNLTLLPFFVKMYCNYVMLEQQFGRQCMSEQNLLIECIRFHMYKEDTLIMRGVFHDDNPEGYSIQVYLDNKELDKELSLREGPDVRRRYLTYHMNVGQELNYEVGLPKDWKNYGKLRITIGLNGEEIEIESVTIKRLVEINESLEGNLEMERVEDNLVILTGWTIANGEMQFTVLADNKEVPIQVTRKYRKDVAETFPEVDEEYLAGFEIGFEDRGFKNIKLIRTTKTSEGVTKSSTDVINMTWVRQGRQQANGNVFKRTIRYFKKNGMRRTLSKIQAKINHAPDDMSYVEFLNKYHTTEEELIRQRETSFVSQPLFSIVIPLYRTKPQFLKELIDTIQGQTYGNWELCLADGSGDKDNLSGFIEPYLASDERINYVLLEDNLGIAGNTNAALKMATGEYIVLCDHDDLMAPDALYECVKAINDNPMVDVLYSDEDKVDMSSKHFFEPHFKSDYNIDLLQTMNYICHLFVFHADILAKVGGFESCYDGAQDYDFIMRCTEQAKEVCHIPKVLYHWRCHRQSTAANPESKLYAFTNGCKALQAHYDRLGIPATAGQGPFYGMYRTRYHWKDQPLLSIIIPNKDHTDDLDKCIKSIIGKSSYTNYEIVIVENNSTEDETFAYYEGLKEYDNVTILYYEGEFNYSKINNYGVEKAKGDYILLLNNDTEMIEPDGIKEMLDICMREDVGIVGARLFFADNTIQHAGVIMGFGGMAGHAFIGQERGDNGYFSRIISTQDLSAVTAACLMTKRSVYEEVEGLSEEYRVAFNDVDYCLKVREAGKLVVYNPYAIFYHYESKSRGQEDSADKVERFNQEAGLLATRWADILTKGDPYYNVNLSLDKADFSLKE